MDSPLSPTPSLSGLATYNMEVEKREADEGLYPTMVVNRREYEVYLKIILCNIYFSDSFILKSCYTLTNQKLCIHLI